MRVAQERPAVCSHRTRGPRTTTALPADKVFAAILLMINVLLPSLALSLFGINAPFFGMLAAWSELAISLLGFYCAGAVFLNSYFGRTLLPLGKPFGFIRKGPAARPAAVVHVIEPVPAAA